MINSSNIRSGERKFQKRIKYQARHLAFVWRDTCSQFWKVTAMFAIVLLLCGCKTVYVPVESSKKDTIFIAKTELVRDSIFLERKEFVKGDTVYITRYKEKTKIQVKTDTVHKERIIEKEKPFVIEKERTRRLPILQLIFAFAIGGLVSIFLFGRD